MDLEAVRLIIVESGKTQRQIAREMEISPSRLGDVLHGRRPFPTKWVTSFCDAAGCDPNRLFSYKKRLGK